MVNELIAEPAEQPVSVEPPTRVLVVDDDVDQLAILTYRLEKLGFDISTALSGEKAIELSQAMKPDLVLLDLCLPDASGFDICEQLVDSEATSHVPVIILSALDSNDVVRQARAAGSAYYLRKPYDPNVLLALIQNALNAVEDTDL